MGDLLLTVPNTNEQDGLEGCLCRFLCWVSNSAILPLWGLLVSLAHKLTWPSLALLILLTAVLGNMATPSDQKSELKQSSETSKSGPQKMQGFTLEDLEEVTGGMTWTHVMVPKVYQSLQNRVISRIGETIASHPAFPEECTYAVEFDTPSPSNLDMLRIWVSFLDEQHLKAFQELKTIDVPAVEGKETVQFAITQPGVQWGADTSDGAVRLLVKNLPKGFGPARLEKALDGFPWGEATRPMVAKASDAHFLKHKGGLVPRAMMVVRVVPHEDDPDCARSRQSSAFRLARERDLLLC